MKTKFLQRVLWLMIPLLTIFTTNVWGETVTIGATDTWTGGKSGGGAALYITKGGITINISSGYKASTSEIRWYSGATMSISSSVGNITVMAFTISQNPSSISVPSGSSGTYNSSTKKWTGNSASFSLKSSAQVKWSSITITYTAAAPKYTLKVSDGLGGYTTYSDKVKSDLTESTAMGGNECTGGLAGYYSGWREGSLETPAASPGTTYNHATAGAMPANGSTLYAVYANNSGKYLTNPLCEETKTLSSIAITTQPTTTKYLVGETFSKTGAVVTATYSDATTANVSASSSWTPTTGLVAGSNTITASYTEGGVTKTATTTVTAYSVTVQKKDEAGTTIADAGVTASASGRTLTASAGSTHYVFKTWKYGTASGTSIASATSASTSLTGTPSAAVTVIAEFYKPCTVTWSVNGSTYTTTANVSYNTTTSTPANPSVPGECTGSTFMGWTSNSSWASDSAPGDLFNGTSPTITGNITFYAVFADEN